MAKLVIKLKSPESKTLEFECESADGHHAIALVAKYHHLPTRDYGDIHLDEIENMEVID